MALMDEFRAEREKMKERPLKDKIAYVWEYYKIPILIVLAILIGATSFIHSQITKKHEALYGGILNTFQNDTGLEGDLLAHMQLDPEKYMITLNKSLQYSAKLDENVYEKYMVLVTMLTTNTLDFVTADQTALTSLAYNSSFADLREVLTKEQADALEPYFMYVDNYILTYNEEHYDGTEGSLITNYPDAKDPASMKEPIPVMLDISQCPEILELYGNPKGITIAMAIPWNPPHPEELTQAIDYFFGK